jgi:hypothetical protein
VHHGPINHARAGAHRWERETNEELEAFVDRAATAARDAGELHLVVGGLRDVRELKAKYGDGDAGFNAWWEAEMAQHYPEVPEPERLGYVPWRAGLIGGGR